MTAARANNHEEQATLVRAIASRVAAEFDFHGFDDLVAAGFLGLVEAETRFDPSRGVLFATFAHYRIRGAMIDHIRKSASLSRRAYAHMRYSSAADSVAEEVAELRAAAPESRADLPSTIALLEETLHKFTAAFVLACLGHDDDHAAGDPEQTFTHREHEELVRRAVDSLPARERTLILGHYFEGRRFDDVAAELGVSKSWASRIHARALDSLRHALHELGDADTRKPRTRR